MDRDSATDLMDPLNEALKGASAADRTSYRPVFHRLPADREGLVELLKREPRVQVFDHLHGQLTELIRSLNPSVRYTAADLDAAAITHLKGKPAAEYGVWVYYPWSQRLVHLLDEQEFAVVRTDRNRNKITREEQALLASKKVGVIGLSVGQSVSLTMALERSFGEIRLADFDTLELSNLNRIRSGVHNLGVSKVVNVAREIAEIDPFLKVTCFHEGITRANIDQFLTAGGKLDVLVEECDSVDVKILARRQARTLGIPVVMETSDRGLIDIERFDLEPDRPIMHGLVEHLDLDAAAQARTSEEKLPFVLPMLGLENLSPRMKASMLEIESTITTWPQLASSVTSGGGTCAHVVRQILLMGDIHSGRWWLDPDDMLAKAPAIGEVSLMPTEEGAPHPGSRVVTVDAPEQLQVTNGTRERFTNAEFHQLGLAASLAPSGGNAQPWRFMLHQGQVLVFLDKDRARSALDPGLRYAQLAMGACVENMMLEAARNGLRTGLQHRPLSTHNDLVAVIELQERDVAGLLPHHWEGLAGQLEARCTNRKASAVMELGDEEAGQLVFGLDVPANTTIQLVRDRRTIDAIATLTGRAERIRFLNHTCHHDMFVKEMRWDRHDVQRTRDGIDLETLELPLADRVGLRVASDIRAMGLLRGWGGGMAIEKITSRSVKASGALAVISVKDLDERNTFDAGRAMERFWLNASFLDILAHPVGAAIFMGLHGRFDREGMLSEREHQEAASILGELKELVDTSGHEPFFLLRLGRATGPEVRSLRRPVQDLIIPSPITRPA
ncbi:MAG: Rv1355c family protein [Flavobacteriales bacterium]